MRERPVTQRVDIAFTAEGGVTLRGWLYLPEGPGLHPAITMAHGYACVKEHGLEKLALLPGGHFDPYLSRFGESSAAARDWFRRHLS